MCFPNLCPISYANVSVATDIPKASIAYTLPCGCNNNNFIKENRKGTYTTEKTVIDISTTVTSNFFTTMYPNIITSNMGIATINTLDITRELTLPKSGITTTFVNPDDVANFEKAIQPNTKLVYIESIGNPNANMIDIEKVAEIAHKNNIPLIVDSTFATPYLLRPFEYGADIVVHSATKFIGGHGTSIGGVIVDSGHFDWEASGKFEHLVQPDPSYHGISFTKTAGKAAYITRARVILLRDTGACLSPFHSFLFLQGLETLSLRVERHVENTIKVVEYLSNHPKVAKVNHPSLPDSPYHELYQKYLPKGGASIFTIEIKGTREDANRFVDSLKLFSLLANVADVKSLVINPAGTTHSQMTDEELNACGIAPTTIRLSIGTEHIDDIIADLEQAFEKI